MILELKLDSCCFYSVHCGSFQVEYQSSLRTLVSRCSNQLSHPHSQVAAALVACSIEFIMKVEELAQFVAKVAKVWELLFTCVLVVTCNNCQ